MGLHRRMTAWVVVSVAAVGGVGGCQIISGLDGIEASASGASAAASAVAATGAGGGAAGGSGSGGGEPPSCPSECPPSSCLPTGDCEPYVVAASELGETINYIAVDKLSGDILWSHQGVGDGDGRIRHVSSKNGQITDILKVNPLSISTDGVFVYWFERSGELKVGLPGSGGPTPIYTELIDSSTTLIAPPPMIVTSKYLFWAVPKQGWQDTVSGYGWRLVLADLSGKEELFADPNSDPAVLAMHEDLIYWHGQGAVKWVRGDLKLDNGQIATGVDESAYGIAVDGEYVYWTEAKSDGRVMRADKDIKTDDVDTLTSAPFNQPHDIAVLGGSVYVLEKGDMCGQGSKIHEIDKLTGALLREFPLEGCPSNFAQSETSLYWAVGTEIYRLVTSGLAQ